MKMKIFNIMNRRKKDYKNIYELELVSGYKIYCYSYEFIAYQDLSNNWILCDYNCGLKVAQSTVSLECATQFLKENFERYLNAIKTQEYQLLCGLFRDLQKK